MALGPFDDETFELRFIHHQLLTDETDIYMLDLQDGHLHVDGNDRYLITRRLETDPPSPAVPNVRVTFKSQGQVIHHRSSPTEGTLTRYLGSFETSEGETVHVILDRMEVEEE